MDLANFLKKKDWSQADLARALDTSLQNVNKWMNGKGVPSYDYCKKLLMEGMTVEDLFGIAYIGQQMERSPMFDSPEFKQGVKEALKELISAGASPASQK